MCLSNSTNFRLFRAKYALRVLRFYGLNSCCKIMEWFIRIRKSGADVAITAINALILISGLTRIKTFVNNFKYFINDFNTFLEVLFCKIYFFNLIIASRKTNESFFNIQIVVFFYHHRMKHKLEFICLEYRIFELSIFVFKRRRCSIIKKKDLVYDPLDMMGLRRHEDIHFFSHNAQH